MSIYRQLWLAISISMIVALAGILLDSLLQGRAYVQQELATKDADNASALALTLSQSNPDVVSVELALAAIFDTGHYESIRVIDPEGKIIIERVSQNRKVGAPAWFIRALPLHAKPGEAQISGGWTQIGRLVLTSDRSIAYKAMWDGMLHRALVLLVAGLIGGYLGGLVLLRLKKPVQAVIRQAEDISNRRFVTIPVPKVPELSRLVLAMNSTVKRLKAMFDEETQRLDAARHAASHDSLTGLANREHFIIQLRAALANEAVVSGSLLMIRIADLAGINKRMGRAATDDLLQRVAKVLTDKLDGLPDAVAARMNGADFAVLLTEADAGGAFAIALLNELRTVMEPFVESGPSAFIGIGHFRPGMSFGVLLSGVDGALISAESEGISGVKESENVMEGDAPMSNDDWSKDIHLALANHWVFLTTFPVKTMDEQILHEESMTWLKVEEYGAWIPSLRFLPVAERLGLAPALDLAAVEAGLTELELPENPADLAVNISSSSISAPEFLVKLKALLAQHPAAAKRLWLEFPEAGALKNIEAFHELCLTLKHFQCRIGVERFGKRFSQIGKLHDLGLDYLKVDSFFIRDLDGNPGNQAFLKGLCTIAHNIDVLVIAEGAVSESERTALKSVGFDGA